MISKSLFTPLLVFILLSSSCSKVQAPEFLGFSDFKIGKVDLRNAEIYLAVRYNNPNNFGVNVKSADVDLYLDSLFISKFIQSEEVAVSKNSSFAIPLKGTIPVSKMLQLNVQNLLSKEVLIRAKGTVSVGKAGVFVRREIDYSGRHSVNLQL